MEWEERPSGLVVPIGTKDPEPDPEPRGWCCFETEGVTPVRMLDTNKVRVVTMTEAQRLILGGEATSHTMQVGFVDPGAEE